ncbi:MAG: hypothetical protein JW983_03435 [Elusimicrobia bacterium]|nr:hypothetical protein [Elusimicrobiota bacterium]
MLYEKYYETGGIMKHSASVVIIASLLSGLITFILSSWFYWNLEERKIKIDTAKRLMGYRYDLRGEGFTKAINESLIIFADDENVVKAIEELYTTLSVPEKPDANSKMLALLKAVCKDIDRLPKNIDNDAYFLKVFNKKS